MPVARFIAVGIEGNGRLEREIAHADAVHGKCARRVAGERVDIHLMLQRRDGAVHRVGFGAQDIGASGDERLGVEPDEMGLKLVGNMRAIGRGAPAYCRATARSRRPEPASPPDLPPPRADRRSGSRCGRCARSCRIGQRRPDRRPRCARRRPDRQSRENPGSA